MYHYSEHIHIYLNPAAMLKKEFQYYIDHQAELVKKYNGKYLVIKDEAVIGVYDSFEKAIEQSQQKGLIPGTYMVQKCAPGEESYTQTFHSRVIFA